MGTESGNKSMYEAFCRTPKFRFEKSVKAFEELEQEQIWNIKDSEDCETIVEIFGDHDELFSFEATFKELYRDSKVKRISAKHRLTPKELKSAVTEILRIRRATTHWLALYFSSNGMPLATSFSLPLSVRMRVFCNSRIQRAASSRSLRTPSPSA